MQRFNITRLALFQTSVVAGLFAAFKNLHMHKEGAEFLQGRSRKSGDHSLSRIIRRS